MTAATQRCAISWSAGKDSWLALQREREAGQCIDVFVTLCDVDGRSKSHALAPELVAAQVRALAGTWRAVRVPEGEYAARFDACLRALAGEGITAMVFGDIDLQAHRDWLAPACARAGLTARFPLWGQSRRALAREILERGVQARIVCVDTKFLDAAFCGLPYDRQFIDRLPSTVCPCGEDGEFHTFVTGGPGFDQPLAVRSRGRRREASRPPFASTEFVFDELELQAQ